MSSFPEGQKRQIEKLAAAAKAKLKSPSEADVKKRWLEQDMDQVGNIHQPLGPAWLFYRGLVIEK